MVTLLFTDIEGSTEKWEQEPERMAHAVARHDALLRAAVEAHRGRVIKTTGDGIYAAFADTADCVAAVILIQQSIADPVATAGMPLSVRCGLHAGMAHERDNDFFGSTVNRAARIMGLAYGGQVLASQAVADLVADRLPAGCSVRYLGEVRLKGMTSLQNVYQVVHPSLRQEFPALRALEATPNNLPQQLTSFIGREGEMLEVKRRLENTRLLTLLGVGGMGKTRLSLQVGADELDDFPDGVWFVPLAPVSDPRLVPERVAAVLGVKEEAGRPVEEALIRCIRDRRLLLILDNCEHLVQACAELTKALLEAGAKVKVLATSREPLHVGGETTYPLPSLTVPDPHQALTLATLMRCDAVRLFVDRAVAAQPAFKVTSANAPAVTAVCHALDGIPLAIELAAARVRTLSVERVAERLADRFRLLTGGDRTTLPRQQTLRACIDWSHDLLGERERAFLRRLAVFAGGWTLEAAETAGIGGDIAAVDVLELLTALVEKSLVESEAAGERYRLLETVRQYALERLAESGEEGRSRDQHLGFYVSLSERAGREISGPKQAIWRARLDAERENILLAFAHARVAPGGAMAGLMMVHALNMWLVSSDIELWHRVTLEALAHPDAQGEDVARSRALYVAAFIAYLTGRYDEAFALAQASVGIARTCGDPLVLGEALYRLGIAAIAVDRLADASEHFVEGLALARQTGDRQLIMSMSCGLGELYSQQDQLESAEPAYLEALACSRGDPQDNVLILYNLARNAIALQAEAKAVQYLREASATVGSQNSIQATQAFLMTCAGVAALREEWAFALRLSGAGALHKEQHSIRGDYVDARFHVRDMAPAREALGAHADAALAAGRAMGVDAALSEAEAWLHSLPAA